MLYSFSLRTLVPGLAIAAAMVFALPAAADACGSMDLVLTKTGPATVQSGGTITYVLTLQENRAGGAATGVEVVDRIPAGLIYVPSATRIESDNPWHRAWGISYCKQEGTNIICWVPYIGNEPT